MEFFADAKRYCNKIWQAVRYFQQCVEPTRRAQFRLIHLNEVNKSTLVNFSQAIALDITQKQTKSLTLSRNLGLALSQVTNITLT